MATAPLHPDELVRRGLKSAKCIDRDTWTATPEAYIRHETDYDGLSIGRTREAVLQLLPNLRIGIAEIRAGTIQRTRNPEDGSHPGITFDQGDHGFITNVPVWERNPLAAESVAGDLARGSVLVPKQQFAMLRDSFKR